MGCVQMTVAYEVARREERRKPRGRKNAATANWSDDRCDRLRELWASGASCRQIAIELGGGVTRNAVIGKVRRMDLPQRLHVSSKTNVRYGKKQARPTPSKPKKGTFMPGLGLPVLPEAEPGDMEALKGNAWAALSNSTPRPLLAVAKDNGCRWPIGEDRPYLFCGEPIHKGSYCAAHAAVAFRPIERKVRAPKPVGKFKDSRILDMEDA